jgi:transcriptional regulator with XRE-family HTH domain
MARSPSPRTWEEYARDLGIELQRCRHAAGLTQEDLAHRAGLTRTHYQQIERGLWKLGQPSNPSVKVLVRLAQVLGIKPGDLLPPIDRLQWPAD